MAGPAPEHARVSQLTRTYKEERNPGVTPAQRVHRLDDDRLAIRLTAADRFKSRILTATLGVVRASSTIGVQPSLIRALPCRKERSETLE